MSVFFFFYNIIITAAFAFCCVGFVVMYNRYHSKSLMCIALIFLLFVLDNLLLYMYEFLPAFSDFYSSIMTASRYMANFLSIAIIFSYRITLLSLEDRSMSKPEMIVWALLIVVEIVTTGMARKLVFGIISDVVLGGLAIAVFADGIYRCRSKSGFSKKAGVPVIKPSFLVFSMVLETIYLVERIFVNFDFYIISFNRFFSIEVLSVLFSVTAFVFLIKNLAAAPTQEKAPEKKPESEAELLKLFADQYGLTQRERDVLAFLAKGYSNADICEAACISEGTVKSHTHNIYQKLDIKNRVQLTVKIKEFYDKAPRG